MKGIYLIMKSKKIILLTVTIIISMCLFAASVYATSQSASTNTTHFDTTVESESAMSAYITTLDDPSVAVQFEDVTNVSYEYIFNVIVPNDFSNLSQEQIQEKQQEQLLKRLEEHINMLDGVNSTDVVMNDESITVKLLLDDKSVFIGEGIIKKYVQGCFPNEVNISVIIEE